jgi:hypothetical protein
VAVAVNFVALVEGKQVVWVGLLALFPLALLLLTGLYLFILPYAQRWRNGRTAGTRDRSNESIATY